MSRGVKIGIIVLFGLLILTPLIWSFTELNSKISLKGDVEIAKKSRLNIPNWLDGSFQEKYEKYINDNVGFRPVYVRIRNQVLYSLFGKEKAAGVIKGKNGYLYERNYIKAYNGTDFLCIDTIKSRIFQLKNIQDSLQKKGKTLLVCLAPGKGSFYPEYFPDKYKLPKTDTTNYIFYAQFLKEEGVNYIDFNRWFLQMKDTSKYILYPKYGIHWSFYGMLLATDSLIKKVEFLRDADLPDLKIGNYHITRKLKRMDYDIADGMNLLFQLPSEPMCYPETEWESATGKTQPKTIVVGDSFYWSMFQLGVWAKSFSPGGFWYYNRQVYPESFTNPTKVEELNMQGAIENNDLFILLVTEANLPKFSWGFAENMINAFNPNYKNTIWQKKNETNKYQSELQKNITNIKANESWMKDIRRKAKKNNISVDSMLSLDARWMIEYKKSQRKRD